MAGIETVVRKECLHGPRESVVVRTAGARAIANRAE
jgi:hypothetical protein